MDTKKPSWWERFTGRPQAELHDAPPPSCYISHAQDGIGYANALARELHTSGVRVYFDIFDLRPGDNWVEKIRDMVQRADALIYLVTPDALHSDVMRSELEFAESHRSRIIPIVFHGLTEFDNLPRALIYREFLVENQSALTNGPSPRVFYLLISSLRQSQEYQPRDPGGEVALTITQEKRPLNEGKMILVGRGEVGKT